MQILLIISLLLVIFVTKFDCAAPNNTYRCIEGWSRIKEDPTGKYEDISEYFTFFCDLSGIKLKSKTETFIPIAENPEKYTKVSISDSVIPLLNKNICEMFPKLTSFKIENNQVEEIDADAFHACHNLKTLDLGSNKISKLDQNSFKNLKYLEELNLERNSITEFSSELLNNMNNLKFLNLRMNRLKNLEIDKILNYIPNIKIFLFDFNFIPQARLYKIIDTIHSKIAKVDYEKWFTSEYWMVFFSKLNDTTTTVTTNDNGTHGCKFQSFYFGNHIGDKSKILSICNFKDINLSKNEIFTPIADNAEKVEWITIYDSVLPVFNNKICEKFPNLQRLTLNNIGLEKIESDAFHACHNLRYLNLRYNNISKLDENLFKNLNKVGGLYLDYNKLTEFPAEIVKNMKELRLFDLRSNNLRDLDFEKIIEYVPDIDHLWFDSKILSQERLREFYRIMFTKGSSGYSYFDRPMMWEFLMALF